jgi:uncharacterized membrane protein (DUF485 family)
MQNTTRLSLPDDLLDTSWREPAEFGAAAVSSTRAPMVEPDFALIADSADFQELRGRLRRFVFPMSALFLAWYLTYVLVAAYEPGFMSIRVLGAVNVGLLMGIGQFVSTIAITVLYVRFAARHVDPLVSEIRRSSMGGDVS